MTDRIEDLRAHFAQSQKNKEAIADKVNRVLGAMNALPPGDPEGMLPLLDKQATEFLVQHRAEIAAGWEAYGELVLLERKQKT